MTTRTVDVLGFTTKPGETASVYSLPLTAITGYSGDADHLVIAFEASGSEEPLHFSFYVPEEYATAASVDIAWFSDGSGGDDVQWTLYYNPVADGEGVDGTSWDSNEVNDSTSTPLDISVASIDLPSSLIQAGDHMQCILARSGDHSADSQAGAVYLLSARFSYDDTA